MSNRSEYKTEIWDTTDLFKSDTNFLEELKEVSQDINEVLKYKNKLLLNSENLYNYLSLDEKLSIRLERLYIYGHINNDEDTRNNKNQELYGKIHNLCNEYSSLSSFVTPELLNSDYEIVDNFIKSDKRLKKYERVLKKIYREKEHVLSKEEERIISKFSKLFSLPDDIQSVLTNSDFTFDSILVNGEMVKLTESNFSTYLKSNNRLVRKSAFESLYNTYKKYNNTLAVILKSEIEMNNINASIRHYKNPLNAALFNNEIDESIYYNLIKSVRENLKTLYKYFDFKKDYLKLDELHIYDTSVELNENDGPKISFEEAKKLVLKAVEPLGEDYVRDLKLSFDNKWIDSINNEGKRGGAYCTNAYGVHPYVLMSFEGNIKDASTLAHELGHAMHFYYANKNQTYQDANTSIFVAEVASQVNEILLYKYLIDHTDDKSFKIKIIDYLLQNFKSTIFRQTMFAEFELFINDYGKDNILTSEIMNNKYYELNKEYFGKNVFVDADIKYEWSRIPHFYYNFYVYQYATGYAAAIKIANEIYNKNDTMRKNYLKFLTLGETLDPVSSLKVCGLDMNSDNVIIDAIKYMDTLINEIRDI